MAPETLPNESDSKRKKVEMRKKTKAKIEKNY